MILSRRRRKTWLVVLAVLVIGGVFVAQLIRERTSDYRAGEEVDGIVEESARSTPDDCPAVQFVNVAEEAGLHFAHFPGVRTNRLPEDMGSGVALGDVDGDGFTDAFLANLSGPMSAGSANSEEGRSRLFRNMGEGRFEDVTASSGIDLVALANAAAFVDVDSDGDLDLFVSTYGTCRLYRNDGEFRFEDISVMAGLEAWEGFWTGIAIADYNRDGAMDIYVCGYVKYVEEAEASVSSESAFGKAIPVLINPSSFEPHANLLLRGRGDGTFEEVGLAAGVRDEKGRGLGAIFCDIDGDSWPDLYVANDVSDNALLLGIGDGTFEDFTSGALVGDYRGAMGLSAGDWDGDLDLDLFITHWVAQENALYTQHPKPGDDARHPVFFDDANRVGLGHAALANVGWATSLFDYDNDGRLDLFVVNGSTIPITDNQQELKPQHTQLFWHALEPREYFHEVGSASGEFFRETHVGRGGAVFDYDLDGDPDLLVSAHGESASLLRNDGGNALAGLQVRLRETTGNCFAIGARVLVTCGENTLLAVVGTQGSYLSQHAVGEVAFGLGTSGRVDRLEVVWPDGTSETAGPFLANSLITWERGSSARVETFAGRRKLDVDGPKSVETQRSFYALRGRAQDARLAGEFQLAVDLYLECLALWPGHGDCLYYLGNSLIETSEEHFALAVFERLVHFEEQSSQGWMQMGLLHLPGGSSELDDIERAEAAFLRCQELNGEESRPILMLGVTSMLSGRNEEAQRRFEAAARLNPRSVEARWFGGQVAWERGDLDRAAVLLSEAHALVQRKDAGESVSNEGDTASGRAMTAAGGPQLAEPLSRWRTLASRPNDPEQEYGDD